MPAARKTPSARRSQSAPKIRDAPALGVAILAGGRSSRMGRDKAALTLQRRTLLGHARASALSLGLRIRVIRKDNIGHCGPLSGIYTALRSSRGDAEIFLACDMPFVSPKLLQRLIRALRGRDRAVFISANRLAGFPFIIRSNLAETVKEQILKGRLSLQQLASSLQARRITLSPSERTTLFNINTPEDLQTARTRSAPARAGRRKMSPL